MNDKNSPQRGPRGSGGVKAGSPGGSQSLSKLDENAPVLAHSDSFDRLDDLPGLDTEMERTLKDIEILSAARSKENKESRRQQISLIPEIEVLKYFREIRDYKLNEVCQVDSPHRLTNGADLMKAEIEDGWNFSKALSEQNMVDTLVKHYRARIFSIIEEKRILLGRIRKVAMHENIFSRHRQDVIQHFQKLEAALQDAVERYDRLSSMNAVVPKKTKGTAALHNISLTSVAAGIETEDLRRYAIDVARNHQLAWDFDLFHIRLKNLNTTDLESLVTILQQERDAPCSFRTRFPLKVPASDVFLRDYESLATWARIGASADSEDGRAFAYNVDKLFHKKYLQNKLNPSPVDLNPPSIQTLGDALVAALDSDEELNVKTPETSPLRILKASWIEEAQKMFGSIMKGDQEFHKRDRIDFQLRYEHDLISSDNIAQAKEHLALTLRYFTEDVLHLKDFDYADDERGIIRVQEAEPPTTQMGVLISRSEGGDIILENKRQKLKDLQASSEDPGQMNEFLLQQRPEKVSALFGSHEIYAFLQLRFLKSREFRMILLRQLNFFRVIEKRLTQDLQDSSWNKEVGVDPVRYETGYSLNDSKTILKKHNMDAVYVLEHHVAEKAGNHDHITVAQRSIYVSNDDDLNVVYDVAFEDLKHVELSLLRMASNLINRNSKDREERDEFFVEHTRARVYDRKDFFDTSFYAPGIDRQQLLLELYDSQVTFNERKIMLINILMELYEHITWPRERQALVDRIIEVISMPRAMDPSDDYILRGVSFQVKALELEERLHIEYFNHVACLQCQPESGRFNFHHGAACQVAITDFAASGFSDLLNIRHQISGLVRDFQVLIEEHEPIATPTVECVIWIKMFELWDSMVASRFRLPETPHRFLFHSDTICAPVTLDNALFELYQARDAEEGNTAAAVHAQGESSAFKVRVLKTITSYIEAVSAYRKLKINWLETHYLRNVLQTQGELMGIPYKALVPKLMPLPFEEAEDGEPPIASFDASDDEDTPTTSIPVKQEKGGTSNQLAIAEADESWIKELVDSPPVIKSWIINGPAVLTEALKYQIVEKFIALITCETNYLIFNRVGDLLKKKTSTVYSGDYISVAFLVGPFKRQLRRQLMNTYYADCKKFRSTPEVLEAERVRLKSKGLATYAHLMSSVLHEQCCRIQVAKVLRIVPENIIAKYSLSRPAIVQTKADALDASKDEFNQNAESMMDLEHGRCLKLWTAPSPTEILLVHHKTKLVDADLAVPFNSIFAKLFQIYCFINEITRLAIVIGDYLNDRGREISRQLLLAIKKEILNFGSPATVDRILLYLSHRWTVLRLRLVASVYSASYCLLVSPTLQPDMFSFLILLHYYQEVSKYAVVHQPTLFCGIPKLFTFRTGALAELSLADKKICTEKMNEIEAFLEDVFHQSNLESLAVENALVNQADYLRNVIKLHQLRFELLNTIFKRAPLQFSQVEQFTTVYKHQIVSSAYREFISNQRRKGSHIEDVSATRAAQMEFERCQVVTIRSCLLALYTKCMSRAARAVLDGLLGETSGGFFADRNSTRIPRPYLINDYPTFINDADFAEKSLVLEQLIVDLHNFSAKTTAPLLATAKEKGRVALEEKSAIVEVDINTNYVVRREWFAQSMDTFSRKLAVWNQSKWRDMDEFYGQLYKVCMDLMVRQRSTLASYTVEQTLISNTYERDVRLGASMRASDIFLELSTIGAELNELKKSRRQEEKLVRGRVRQEYEELVTELSSQIHKLKARFNEFKINSVDETMAALSEVKKEDLLGFIKKDYHKDSTRFGNTVIQLQESIDELRSDNAELKQVLSKLKSMYYLKDKTGKSAFSKRIAKLIEDKREAEERLWESYRESEAREKVLRKNLIKCQKDLVSIETQHESLKRTLREEQKAKQLLQKALSVHVNENKTNMEMASLRKVETFTKFEFERLLDERNQQQEEIAALRQEVTRLQTTIQSQEWKWATKQRLHLTNSACRPGSPRVDLTMAALATSSSPPPPSPRDEYTIERPRSVGPAKRPMTAKREQVIVPAIRVAARPRTAVSPIPPK